MSQGLIFQHSRNHHRSHLVVDHRRSGFPAARVRSGRRPQRKREKPVRGAPVAQLPPAQVRVTRTNLLRSLPRLLALDRYLGRIL